MGRVDPGAYRAAVTPSGNKESLVGSLAEANANLEMLEHMWGPSDFTVTGILKSYDRTSSSEP